MPRLLAGSWGGARKKTPGVVSDQAKKEEEAVPEEVETIYTYITDSPKIFHACGINAYIDLFSTTPTDRHVWSAWVFKHTCV